MRWRASTNAIHRPSGENAGAVPRTTRRDAPPDGRQTVIHPPRANATREPSPDQDGERPRPIDRSAPGRPIHTRPSDATASVPRTDQTASDTPRNPSLRGCSTVAWRIPSIPSSTTLAPDANVSSVPSPRNAGAAATPNRQF